MAFEIFNMWLGSEEERGNFGNTKENRLRTGGRLRDPWKINLGFASSHLRGTSLG
jgi:hypothetical protein